MTLTIQEIMDFLPHRYPFLLIDRMLSSNAPSAWSPSRT
jgi:3-hydroxymyristoyl/3-hydroxydecanoyl-(acyl carrier protein) dehydratase